MPHYLTKMHPPRAIGGMWRPSDHLLVNAKPALKHVHLQEHTEPGHIGLMRSDGSLWLVADIHGSAPTLLEAISRYETVSADDLLPLGSRSIQTTRTGVIKFTFPSPELDRHGNWAWARPYIVPRTVPATYLEDHRLLYSCLAA